jgi:hypothetical protein
MHETLQQCKHVLQSYAQRYTASYKAGIVKQLLNLQFTFIFSAVSAEVKVGLCLHQTAQYKCLQSAVQVPGGVVNCPVFPLVVLHSNKRHNPIIADGKTQK